MEAVTTRGYLLVIILVILGAGLLPPATAAPVTFSHAIAPSDYNATIDRVQLRYPFLEEFCAGPYRLLCVGPYDEPDKIIPLGRTGISFAQNDTGGLVLVDRERVQSYGPYIVNNPIEGNGIGDDIRICYWKCQVTNPVYARAHANASVAVYAAGSQLVKKDLEASAQIGANGTFPFPPPFGCPGYRYPCP